MRRSHRMSAKSPAPGYSRSQVSRKDLGVLAAPRSTTRHADRSTASPQPRAASRFPNSTVSDEPSAATVPTSRPQLPRLLLLRLQRNGAPGFFIERATRPEPRWSPRAPSTLLERDPYVLGARLKTLAGGIRCGARTLPPPWGDRNHSRIEPPTASRQARRNTAAPAARRSAAVYVVCLPASERPRSYTVPSSPVKMTTSDGCRAAACAARAARASIGRGCGDSRPVRLALQHGHCPS
jgi:hypothetical protein